MDILIGVLIGVTLYLGAIALIAKWLFGASRER